MNAPPHKSSRLLERLSGIVGPAGLITDAQEMAPHLVDWVRLHEGRAAAVVRPADTGQVAAVVRACIETRTAIVPQGGNTSQCGGATPDASGDEIVLNLGRMNRIVELDALNNTVAVEAGCLLADIREAAEKADRFFPLSLGAEGSCQIGGNLSTNAGGRNVLRYGNARDFVLGLEVVLADGRVWNGLRALRKDNTGYDLKHLFIGAEGTLGIITQAVLKLFPRPRSTVTALAAVPSPAAGVALLALLRETCGERISGFELISRSCFDMVFRQYPACRDPFRAAHPWYILVELSDTRARRVLREEFEEAFASPSAAPLVIDAVCAQNEAQAAELLHLREAIPQAARLEGLVYRHDIAVAVSRIPEFITAAQDALETHFPGVRIICFGHLGDGNLHFNAFVPGRDRGDARAHAAIDVNRTVNDIVNRLHGSISAEHGIGQSRRGELRRYKSDTELDLMRTLKHALDPENLFNPGKIL